MYNDLLDSDQFHCDDLIDDGPALEAVRFVTVDREAAASRNITYIRENIAREKLYQLKKWNDDPENWPAPVCNFEIVPRACLQF